MSNYRYDFIKKYPGKKRSGRKGLWYRCANCGGWCGRPGNDKVNIPDDQKMEVDHIRPWSRGGTDEVWNLQALCKPCNRAKSNSMDFSDSMKSLGNTLLHPVDSLIKTPVRKALRQNKVLKKTGLTSRK